MLMLTITDGPRWNLRGPDLRATTPAQVAHYLQRWYPGAQLWRSRDGALRFEASAVSVAPELSLYDPGLMVCGVIEVDLGGPYPDDPVPSIPDDGLWPATQPTEWSAEPDDTSETGAVATAEATPARGVCICAGHICEVCPE